MSLAAVDLQGGNERIIDIAEKYGYRSPTAFNRAFQSTLSEESNPYIRQFLENELSKGA